MNDTISNRYLELHNYEIEQERILKLLSMEFGIPQVLEWAKEGSINNPEGKLSQVVRDKTKYTAPGLEAYL